MIFTSSQESKKQFCAHVSTSYFFDDDTRVDGAVNGN